MIFHCLFAFLHYLFWGAPHFPQNLLSFLIRAPQEEQYTMPSFAASFAASMAASFSRAAATSSSFFATS